MFCNATSPLHADDGLRRRIVAWLLTAGALAAARPQTWLALTDGLPNQVLADRAVAPWAALGLCAMGVWLKRRDIAAAMRSGTTPAYIAIGLALAGAGVALPFDDPFLVLQFLTIVTGMFIAFFGQAGMTPAALLSVYALSVAFPVWVEEFVATPYRSATAAPALEALRGLGVSISEQGNWINFGRLNGDRIIVLVNTACAGPATMALFFVMFAIMRAEFRVSPRATVTLFCAGVIGTWLQNVLRLLALLLSGYFWGENVLWDGHYYLSLVWFPLWYLAFAAMYLRYAKANGEGRLPPTVAAA